MYPRDALPRLIGLVRDVPCPSAGRSRSVKVAFRPPTAHWPSNEAAVSSVPASRLLFVPRRILMASHGARCAASVSARQALGLYVVIFDPWSANPAIRPFWPNGMATT